MGRGFGGFLPQMEFSQLWRVRDGRHIAICKPAHSWLYCCNYKGYFSIVLLALTNANYEFVMIDVGTNGRVSDGGVLENTLFCDKLKNNELELLNKNKGGGFNIVFIGDYLHHLISHYQ
ncbi:hypothetical protein PR048_022080 [Dryococelus australis]|uniref:DDE Tnp4 domain-containing protein n=1 Tax=Dryococelus australis TaxID=614101 RepID=A0ABQ9H032_9NEOP|nr:hypothetical protein PR048_022080 [Dryococelus australis]